MKPGRITLLLLASVVIALIVPAVPALSDSMYHYQNFPPMQPGQEPGSVTGRVAYALTGVGIPYAHVTIVNASNSSLKYASLDADSTGCFHFYPVNSTNGERAYKLVVQAIDKTTYSESFAVGSGIDMGMDVPIYVQDLAMATPTPQPVLRNLSGTVADESAGLGIPGVTVAIVNALNPDYTYNTTLTDSQGRYSFENVSDIIPPGYKLHLQKEGYESTASGPFTMDLYPLAINVTMKQKPSDEALADKNASTSPSPAVTTAVTVSSAPTSMPGEATSAPTQSSTTPAPAPGFGAIPALLGTAVAFACAARAKK